jgi:penicillin-binding protein 1C
MRIISKKKVFRLALAVAAVFLIAFLLETAAGLIWPFPQQRLEIFAPSPRVLDSEGRNMLSLVSDRQQWCFPVSYQQISPHMIKATIAVEDGRFYQHSGVDLLAASRAMGQMLAYREVVSGASTITMQVCRMMDDRPRTLAHKMIEIFRARQLERLRTKDEILAIYLNYAPYGGNIRGIEAASQFYFSKNASELSIAQSAFLAGLPKSPTFYNPVRHFAKAQQRQKFVLDRMLESQSISFEQYQTAQAEAIEITGRNPELNPSHAAWWALSKNKNGGKTTIDADIQGQVEKICGQGLKEFPPDSEIAVVVIDIASSSIVAMVGSGDYSDPVDGQVNGAVARRSPGSALKPFIYAQAFEQKRLSPEELVYDVPISIAGWKPSNFDKKFYGELPAAQALRKSLNIPAIWIAKNIGIDNCFNLLDKLGFEMSPGTQKRSGLSFVVGGCEVSLLELTNAYAVFGRGGEYSSPCLYNEQIMSRRIYSENVCDNINQALSCRSRLPLGIDNIEPDKIPWFIN